MIIMTDQKRWVRHQENHPVCIVGEFENEHGERFVLYRNGTTDNGPPAGDKIYITGDEFDWEPRIGLLWGDFMFSNTERDKISRILWPNPLAGDSIDDYMMSPSRREIFSKVLSDHPGIRTDLPLGQAMQAWQEQENSS